MPVSTCPSVDPSNIRQFDGKCYTAVNDSVNWYEARNRCLKGGGDLASFANVTSINFTSWLVSHPAVRYWIGLRFGGYIWKDSGRDYVLVMEDISYCFVTVLDRTDDCNKTRDIIIADNIDING